MSFTTLAKTNGVSVINGFPVVYTGLMTQLTKEGMLAFCKQYRITYQNHMEDDFRIKIYLDSDDTLLYTLYAREEDKEKYPSVEAMSVPCIDKDSLKNEMDFLSGMFEYLNNIKIKQGQTFVLKRIVDTISGNRQTIQAMKDKEEAVNKSYSEKCEQEREMMRNYEEAESKQHHPYIFALCIFALFFISIPLMLNADTSDFGAFLMFVFFIFSIIGPFIAAWMSHDNVKIRHEHGVYDRERDIKDNAATIGCIGIGVKNLHTTGKKLHSTLYGDGKHHKV